MAKGRAAIVGVMLPYIHHPYFSAIMGGIPKEALRYGYQLLLVQTNYDVERELEALERLRMRQMDGLIVCSREVGWEAFAAYQEDGPIVLCEHVREHDFLAVYTVALPHFQLGGKAFRLIHHWLETGNVTRKQEELPARLLVRDTA